MSAVVGRRVLGCSAAQWRLVALFLALSLIPLTGLAVYIRGTVRDLQVQTAVGGLMNFADAKQQGVIRFLGQNEKFATELAAQINATGPDSVRPLFTSTVATDVFHADDHPFTEEIAAGTRHIPTLKTYQAVDFVRGGVIVVSSDQAREGLRWDRPVDLSTGYSDVYLVDNEPYLTFGAPARDGMVYVHADALMLTNIVNGEIGNLEGKAGAFYLAGVGKTFDYYLVNRNNIMITESRVHPAAMLTRTGSVVPWTRTQHGAHDPVCHAGKYTPNAGVATGCREAMGFYPSPDGHEMLGASMPFYDSGWTIVVEQDSAELLAPLTALQNRIWAILGVIVLLIVMFAVAVARRVTVKETSSLAAVHEASHDSLTGLPGRTLFLQRLDHELAASGGESEVSVLFIDLARFKAVNDTLGHHAGDELLVKVGERIRDCLRDEDLAARLGGDEFAVLVAGAGAGTGVRVGERIIDALKRPILICGKEIFIGASIGVADVSSSRDASQLLGNADLAMYCAKKEGSRRPVMFAEHMLTGLVERLELPGELQQAIGTEQIWVQYQPLLDLNTGVALGVEALARWTHPARGTISPALFIPMAEETGAIVDLGRWVLRESCRQAAQWRQEDNPTLTLSVNVSARQLLDGQLAIDIEEILTETGLPPAALTLELTESILMDEPAKSLHRLRELKGLGVRLAIDDFGTGYSSLSYLRQFPVDELKIDKSFIDRINAGQEDFAIVRTVIELAHTLDMQTIAEGIETPDQLDSLRRLGCELGQGYHFARPLDPDRAHDYLANHRQPSGQSLATTP
ncbi:EAL domain-containing protein [Actinoplanes sp. NPDC051470]|uniref:putative bifunctional diguanylate cyclase/phosphodiesterase n=1 Tax=Actinoplanes sp. NPDC051470 TaxID=3157224 RepID=UPI003416689E